MKNSLSLLIGIVVAFVLLMYMFLYRVRYDEVAVLTTFGDADVEDIHHAKAWPYLRWPWPIQQVTRYPTRLQLLADQLEEQQTADRYGVIIQTFLAWRVEDPLEFFSKYQQLSKAEERLKAQVRDARGIISQYNFHELVNTDAAKLKLTQIEEQVAHKLQEEFKSHGIGIEKFGITRIKLPDSVTTLVFEQMRETREQMADRIRKEGDGRAKAITSKAESIRDRILAFAEGNADRIRSQGDREASEIFKTLARNEELAVYLRWLKKLEEFFKDSKATVVMNVEDIFSPDFELPVGRYEKTPTAANTE